MGPAARWNCFSYRMKQEIFFFVGAPKSIKNKNLVRHFCLSNLTRIKWLENKKKKYRDIFKLRNYLGT